MSGFRSGHGRQAEICMCPRKPQLPHLMTAELDCYVEVPKHIVAVLYRKGGDTGNWEPFPAEDAGGDDHNRSRKSTPASSEDGNDGVLAADSDDMHACAGCFASVRHCRGDGLDGGDGGDGGGGGGGGGMISGSPETHGTRHWLAPISAMCSGRTRCSSRHP